MNKVYLSFCYYPFEATRVRVNNSITFLSLMNSLFFFSPYDRRFIKFAHLLNYPHWFFYILYYVSVLYSSILLSFWLFTSNHLLWAYLIFFIFLDIAHKYLSLRLSFYCVHFVLEISLLSLLCCFYDIGAVLVWFHVYFETYFRALNYLRNGLFSFSVLRDLSLS